LVDTHKEESIVQNMHKHMIAAAIFTTMSLTVPSSSRATCSENCPAPVKYFRVGNSTGDPTCNHGNEFPIASGTWWTNRANANLFVTFYRGDENYSGAYVTWSTETGRIPGSSDHFQATTGFDWQYYDHKHQLIDGDYYLAINPVGINGEMSNDAIVEKLIRIKTTPPVFPQDLKIYTNPPQPPFNNMEFRWWLQNETEQGIGESPNGWYVWELVNGNADQAEPKHIGSWLFSVNCSNDEFWQFKCETGVYGMKLSNVDMACNRATTTLWFENTPNGPVVLDGPPTPTPRPPTRTPTVGVEETPTETATPTTTPTPTTTEEVEETPTPTPTATGEPVTTPAQHGSGKHVASLLLLIMGLGMVGRRR
jgi:hypothetical protein